MKKLFRKYVVTKADGAPVDPEAQYFVLRLDTDDHARVAMRAYIESVGLEDKEFADELREWLQWIESSHDILPSVLDYTR